MSIGGDILRSWRAPRQVVAGLLASGPREDRALAHLMIGCALVFVAQWPALARAAAADPSVPLAARLGGALMATMFLLPLILYALAAASHILMRALGRPTGWAGARVALFWALLASGPLILVNGLVRGLPGTGGAAGAFGWAVLAAFLWLWGGGLAAAGAIASDRSSA